MRGSAWVPTSSQDRAQADPRASARPRTRAARGFVDDFTFEPLSSYRGFCFLPAFGVGNDPTLPHSERSSPVRSLASPLSSVSLCMGQGLEYCGARSRVLRGWGLEFCVVHGTRMLRITYKKGEGYAVYWDGVGAVGEVGHLTLGVSGGRRGGSSSATIPRPTLDTGMPSLSQRSASDAPTPRYSPMAFQPFRILCGSLRLGFLAGLSMGKILRFSPHSACL